MPASGVFHKLGQTGLWRHHDFIRLWTGQTISVFGSIVGSSAMAFTAILVLHATPFQLGLLAAARLAPGFLCGLAAGAWVDRRRRRPILIGADLGRAVLLATIPLARMLGILRMEQLYVVALLVSILTVVFDIAYPSYVPSLIGREALVEGNSKLAASASVAEVGGFAIAGWLVQAFTAPLTILIDAVSFAVSGFSVWRIRLPETPPARDPHPDIRREIAEGLKAIRHDRLLRALATCIVSKEFFGGMYGAGVVLYMARDLGFAPGILGAIWAVGGISSLMGAGVAGKTARHFGIGPTMVAGLLLSGIAMFFIPLARGKTVTAALLLILQQISGDGAATVYQINHVSLRQVITPERLLGRVNASAEFLGLGATFIGSLIGGLLGETIGVRTTLFWSAFGCVISTVWLVASPVRGVRGAPIRACESL